MKTLYDRLEPEVIEGLEINKEKYAVCVKGVVNSLTSNKFWPDLTVAEARQVIVFSDYPMNKVTSRTLLWGHNIIKYEE